MSDCTDLISIEEIIETWKLVIKPSSKLEWKISELTEEQLNKSLEELEDIVKPNETLRKLRSNFHYEAQKALAQGKMLQVSDIVKGICGTNHFLKIIDDSNRLAYLLIPYADQKSVVYHQGNLAMERLSDILSAKIIDKEGQLDNRNATLVLQAIRMLYDRVFPVTQRIHQITEDGTKKSNSDVDLEDRIKQLEKELGKKC